MITKAENEKILAEIAEEVAESMAPKPKKNMRLRIPLKPAQNRAEKRKALKQMKKSGMVK